MIALLLGFATSSGDADPQPLYLGNDAAAALAIQDDPPEGIARTEFYRNMVVDRRQYHEPAPVAVHVHHGEPEAEPAPKKRGRPRKTDTEPPGDEDAPADDDTEPGDEEPGTE